MFLRAWWRGSSTERKPESSQRVQPQVEALEERIYLSRSPLSGPLAAVPSSVILVSAPETVWWTFPNAATLHRVATQTGSHSAVESLARPVRPAGTLLVPWEQPLEGAERPDGNRAGAGRPCLSPGEETRPWQAVQETEDWSDLEARLTDEFFAQGSNRGHDAQTGRGATTETNTSAYALGEKPVPPSSDLPGATTDRLGASGLDRPGRVLLTVTATVRDGAAEPGSVAQTPPFAIRRLEPASGGPVRVHFDLTTIYRQGELRSRSHAVNLSARDESVAIPARWICNGSGSEIVMLTVRSNPAYQAQPATVSWFVPGAASRCSEAALLRAYLHGGCQQAFTALVQQHRPQVLRICRQILGNYADAEDVSQNVFLMLATRPPKSDQSLPGWLHTVARNAAISYLRSRTRRAYHEAEAARELATQSVGTSKIPVEDLEAALARLSAPFQKAVRLRYLHNYSQQEAAQLMGCPRGTLAQRAARGIMQLRQILQQALCGE